jgi:hypothetical protein
MDEQKRDEVEYVGAPTEFADAEEVPEWVANIARILFFLPAAVVTATTIPIIMGILLVMACGVIFCVLSAFL